MADALITPARVEAPAPLASASTTRTSHETSLWTRFAYGFGSVAFGVNLKVKAFDRGGEVIRPRTYQS